MKKMITLSFFLIIVIGQIALYSADWPKWRGPNSNGVSRETGWNPEALKGNPEILWKTEIGKGHSSIVVVGDYLYTMGNRMTIVGKDTVFEDMVSCLKVKDGKEVWRYIYPCAYINYPGPRATPTVDDGFVYTLSWEGHLYCFYANNGRVKWMKNLVDANLSHRPNWGFCGSPVIDGDLLILNAGSGGVALNKRTGAVIWKSENVSCTLPTPILFSVGNRHLVGITRGDKIHVKDVETGEEQWTYPWYQGLDIDPLLTEEGIFMASGRGSRYIETNGKKHKVIMENRRMSVSAWQHYVIMGDYMYGFARERRKMVLKCFNITTGEEQWKKDLGDFGSLIGAGKHLVVLTGDGRLVIANATAEAYQEISQAKVLKMTNNTGLQMPQQNHCWTMPVLANGCIYVRNCYGELACVDVSKETFQKLSAGR